MHDEPRQRPGASAAGGDRAVEAAALAILVERHPELLALAELVEEMSVGSTRPGRREAIERAVDGLVAVDLLRWQGERLVPTPAALRAAELELGL
jgi:hypothetical protein